MVKVPVVLGRISEWFKRRQKVEEIYKIDLDIARAQRALSRLPRSHRFNPLLIYELGTAQLKRYMRSDQREDLDKAITHLTSLLPPDDSSLIDGRLPLRAALFLALALNKRATLSKQPEDAIRAAKYLRNLRGHPHKAPGISLNEVTGLLVEALAFQVKSGTGNAMQHIGEISLLCHELLTSNAPDRFTSPSIVHFADAVFSKFRVWNPDLPLDQVIECLQLARMRKPKLRVAHIVLALCLTSRYYVNLVNDDYEASASILRETSSSPGDSQDEYLAVLQTLVEMMAVTRSHAHTTPEEAMYHARAYLVDHGHTVIPYDILTRISKL